MNGLSLVRGFDVDEFPGLPGRVRRRGKFNKTRGFTHLYLVNSLTGFLLGGNSDGGW